MALFLPSLPLSSVSPQKKVNAPLNTEKTTYSIHVMVDHYMENNVQWKNYT